MKKITCMLLAVVALSLGSCKKDRNCECTTTHTSPSGNVTTDPTPEVIVIKDTRKHDAKSYCQSTKTVDVDDSGGTDTYESKCKIK